MDPFEGAIKVIDGERAVDEDNGETERAALEGDRVLR